MTELHDAQTDTGYAAPAGAKSPHIVFGLVRRWLLPVAVLSYCLASFTALLAELITRFSLLGEAGYGDLYVFHTVQQYLRTGAIYPDSAREVPAVYGPMLYTLLALPGRLMTGINPLLGPRLIVVCAFTLCVTMTVLITRALLPHRRVWLWSLPLALSFTSMPPWLLQIRGDFLSIFFGLLAIRLLLVRTCALKTGASAVPASLTLLMAGICAGFATQFKPTYVAAFGSGLLWLAANRRWKAAAVFAAGGGLASVGIYSAFILREPGMIDNMLALRRPIVDYAGAWLIMQLLANQPVPLFGLAVLPLLRWRWRDRWTLPGLFVVFSFIIAATTALQVGANSNYFFEFLFGLVPLAALGIFKLRRRQLRGRWALLAPFTVIACGIAAIFTELQAGSGGNALGLMFGITLIASAGILGRRQTLPRAICLSLSTVLLFSLAQPVASSAFGAARSGGEKTRDHNSQMTELQAALYGQSVLSFVAGASFFAPDVVLSDPFLASYSERLGRFDLRPLAARIQNREFDLIVTPSESLQFRGIYFLSSTLRPAMTREYQPFCTIHKWVMLLPRVPQDRSGVSERLIALGCDANACFNGPACRSW